MYLALDAFTFFGPLLLSFDKKVAYYTKWAALLPGMAITMFFFLVWDSYFTYQGVWSFNNDYLIGFYIGNMPIEEWLFFIVVPFACTFIYECVICYFPFEKRDERAENILKILGLGLFIVGLYHYDKYYTSWNFVLLALYILLIFVLKKHLLQFNMRAFLISFLITLIPFFLVNGVLTALPIISYNNDENLGIRMYTIPFEDIFYGMLLMLMNVSMYEMFKKRTVFKNK